VNIAIMAEGQADLNWPRWQALARAVERLGFYGLYRSDHFTDAEPPDRDSLELWVSLTWLASNTSRIIFGPLVSPVSFRHPAMTARMAAAVDDLSGGRLQLGLGAGWQEREHFSFSFDLLPMPQRLRQYEEGLQVVTGLLQRDVPLSFEGSYYMLHGAVLLPRPQRPGGPPIVIGGRRGVLPLVVRYGSEWNVPFAPPDEFRNLSSRLDQLLREGGREPSDVRRSLMTGLVFGRDEADLIAKLDRNGRSLEELRRRGIIAGTASPVVEQLQELAEAGVQTVMLQWLDYDDLAGLEAFATAVLGRV
jgi:F420-dependent oxidoreductase-like protein